MRVVVASDWFVRYSAGLCRGLADLGAQVTFVTRTHDFEFGGTPGAMSAWVTATLEGRASHLRLGGRVRDLGALPQAWEMRRAVRRFAPDIVHFQDGVASDPRLIALSRARPRRFALTVHDPVFHPGDRRPPCWHRLAVGALRRGAGLIFVHGEALREELIKREAPRAPVVVVPLGPLGAGAPRVRALPEQPALLFFGRISFYKGLDVLLDAMPIVWRELPDARLTVAGEGPLPDHPVLTDPRVTVRHGHVPDGDVPSLFEQATCLVLPYRQASQSGVGSLAKLYGRAIVATATGALPELVGGDAGVVVPPEDPEALAAALIKVIANPGRAQEIGRAAARSAEGEAGWARVAEHTLAAYERYLGQRRGDPRASA
jgi:glycosyltransferase involved in cell wall biosynthesis